MGVHPHHYSRIGNPHRHLIDPAAHDAQGGGWGHHEREKNSRRTSICLHDASPTARMACAFTWLTEFTLKPWHAPLLLRHYLRHCFCTEDR
eukprot:1157334-Pelagomonas_calceolata.AAC.6